MEAWLYSDGFLKGKNDAWVGNCNGEQQVTRLIRDNPTVTATEGSDCAIQKWLYNRYGEHDFKRIMSYHYMNATGEEQFKTMANIGINFIRVPVNWWMWGDMDEGGSAWTVSPWTEANMNNGPTVRSFTVPTALGSIPCTRQNRTAYWYVDYAAAFVNVAKMAHKHGMKIVVDMHNAPGVASVDQMFAGFYASQCLFFNSNVYKNAMLDIWEKQVFHVLDYLEDMYPGVVHGVEILNEPGAKCNSQPYDYHIEWLEKFKNKNLRKGEKLHVYVSLIGPASNFDTFQNSKVEYMRDTYTDLNVVADIHAYFDYEQIATNEDFYTMLCDKNYICDWNNQNKCERNIGCQAGCTDLKDFPIIVGEWSAAVNSDTQPDLEVTNGYLYPPSPPPSNLFASVTLSNDNWNLRGSAASMLTGFVHNKRQNFNVTGSSFWTIQSYQCWDPVSALMGSEFDEKYVNWTASIPSPESTHSAWSGFLSYSYPFDEIITSDTREGVEQCKCEMCTKPY